MAKINVVESLNESKRGFRKCWFVPQPPSRSQKAVPSVPSFWDLAHQPSPEFSVGRCAQLSAALRGDSAASLPGLILGQTVMCHVVT